MNAPAVEGNKQLPPVVESRSADWPLGGRRAWVVFLSALAIYILAIFHRTSLGVAGIMAAERFHISSAQLATFVMVQLFVYAAMQVPVGALLDRFGSKVLLFTGVTIMTIAQFGFAFADTFALGVLARVFVGMGDAMVFISLLRIVALWFPPARAPMMSQLCGVFGQLGAIAAAGPLSAALHHWGWTSSYVMASSIGIVLAMVLLVVGRDSPYKSKERTEIKLRAIARAVSSAWREPGTKLGLWCHFTSQFSTTVFSLMWGFPFLTKGEGLSPATASLLLEIMVVATVTASPLFGAFTARYPYNRSTLVLGSVGAIMAIWAVVLLWPGRAPLWLLIVLVVITSVGGPGSMIGFDLARTFNPAHRIGSASGIVNVGGFTATLLSVFVIGVILDRAAPGGAGHYDLHAFRVAMSFQYVMWAFGIVQILRYRRRTRRLIARDDDYRHLRVGVGMTGDSTD